MVGSHWLVYRVVAVVAMVFDQQEAEKNEGGERKIQKKKRKVSNKARMDGWMEKKGLFFFLLSPLASINLRRVIIIISFSLRLFFLCVV